MTLIKWHPWQEMEDVLNRYAKAVHSSNNDNNDWTPRVDISENSDAFLIKADIPDVDKENVKVNIENGVLTIHGERKKEVEQKNQKFHRVERIYGSFSRSFTLPENVDTQKIEASFDKGVLTVQLPKVAVVKSNAIEIAVR